MAAGLADIIEETTRSFDGGSTPHSASPMSAQRPVALVSLLVSMGYLHIICGCQSRKPDALYV